MNLDDDGFCFVCGRNNPRGLRLSFSYSDGKVTSEFTPTKIYQGYRDITHGGIIASILDEAMIQAAISEGSKPVTAEIQIRFRMSLAVNEPAVIVAEVTRRGTRLLEARSRIFRKGDGTVIAEAQAKLLLKEQALRRDGRAR